jgi:hypothetical protein
MLVIKSRRMRVAGLGERRGSYKVWYGYLRKRDHMEDPGFIKMGIQEVG